MSCYDWTADPSSTSPVVNVELIIDAHGHPVVSVDTVTGYDEMIEARYTRTTKSSLTYATGAHLSWDLPDAPMVPQPFLGDEAFITMRETHSVYPQGEA
jgi:hypothetical protein